MEKFMLVLNDTIKDEHCRDILGIAAESLHGALIEATEMAVHLSNHYHQSVTPYVQKKGLQIMAKKTNELREKIIAAFDEVLLNASNILGDTKPVSEAFSELLSSVGVFEEV